MLECHPVSLYYIGVIIWRNLEDIHAVGTIMKVHNL